MKNVYGTSDLWMIIVAVVTAAIIFSVTCSHAQSFGDPIYTSEKPGLSISYGKVTCTQSGVVILDKSLKYTRSVMFQNTSATTAVFICPAGVLSVSGSECSADTGLKVAAGAALVLDQGNGGTGTSGYKCLVDNLASLGTVVDLRYYTEG